MNKRGQGLSTNAIILIVLGVVVLVVLIGGFTLGWGQLRDKITSSNNVATIAQACGVACSTGSQFDYCSVDRELNDGTTEITNNCNEFSGEENKDTYGKYGIEKCPQITCPKT